MACLIILRSYTRCFQDDPGPRQPEAPLAQAAAHRAGREEDLR